MEFTAIDRSEFRQHVVQCAPHSAGGTKVYM